MKVELVKIGNSQGIRIPKHIIEQCGFKKTVDIQVRDNSLIISSTNQRRRGWNKAFRSIHENKDDLLLDTGIIQSDFDDNAWTW